MNVSSEILRHLRAGASPVSELASKCGVSIDAIRMEIDQLQAAGFFFEQHPMLGCSLVSCPDRLIADDIFSRLESDWIQEILVFVACWTINVLHYSRLWVPNYRLLN